ESPHAPIGRFLTFVGTEEVGSFRGATPIVSRVFNEAVSNVIGPDTEMELVIDESVLSTSEREFPDALQRAYDLDQFTLYLSPDDIGYGLTLVDGRVFLGAYDESGNLVASADGNNERLRDWATARYTEFRRVATEAKPGRQSE
ncbi:MAG: hypothetical protein R3282_07530, partial [Rhodothermales bacterium]|nr:hypothetical protein [Rhodothermales bacterium]